MPGKYLNLALYLISLICFGFYIFRSYHKYIPLFVPLDYSDCLTKKISGTYNIVPGLSCSVTFFENLQSASFRDCENYRGNQDNRSCTLVYLNTVYVFPQNYSQCLSFLPPFSGTPPPVCEFTLSFLGVRDTHLADRMINDCWHLTGYTGSFGDSCTVSYSVSDYHD